MARISLIVATLIATSALAGDAPQKSWYGDWWENVYEQRIEREQYEQLQNEMQDRCSTKIEWYRRKLAEDPTSEYYKYKLEDWRSKCPPQ